MLLQQFAEIDGAAIKTHGSIHCANLSCMVGNMALSADDAYRRKDGTESTENVTQWAAPRCLQLDKGIIC